MARIPHSVIDEIRARIDIAELIAGYGVAVRRVGSSWKACCPFHREKTPSFHIRPDHGMYHCFGCGESGDCFKFVMKQEGMTFVEAVKKLAARVGVEITEDEDPHAGERNRLYALHAELAAFYRRCLKEAKEAAAARAYLEKRAIPEEIAEQFLVGYAPMGTEAMLTWARKNKFRPEELAAAGVLLPPTEEIDRWYNRFGGRLMFTIRDRQGRAIAFSGRFLGDDKTKAKYVNSPETAIFRKSNVLYAFDRAAGAISKAPKREAIVCEGQIDVIRCHACGFTTAVASQGTAFTEEHVRALKRCADSVVLVFDADGAGRKAAVRTGGEFLAAEVPVRVATLPAGEDPDSFLRTQGAAAFQARLDASESITHFQVRTLREAEASPDAIDAVRRIARAALETVAKCPSAVMRAALVREAATLMNVPPEALESDLREVLAANARKAQTADAIRSTANVSVPTPDAASKTQITGNAGESAFNPPSAREQTFCEFLFTNPPETAIGQNGRPLGELVAQYAPDALFAHPFTRDFVRTWAAGGDWNALRNRLTPTEADWLDGIFLHAERAAFSEMSLGHILEDYLRMFWHDALKRILAAMPADDERRLLLGRYAGVYLRGKFEKALALMKLETLGIAPLEPVESAEPTTSDAS